MKANKNRTSSDERDNSKSPSNQIPSGSMNSFTKSGEKIEDGYYNGFIKQLNDKKHIKVHHPFLKKNSVKYDSKSKSKKLKSDNTNLTMESSGLPSLATDKTRNTDDTGTPTDDNENMNLPTLVKHFTTQMNQKNENHLESNSSSRDFFEGVERNDNVSLLKLQFSDRVPNSRQTSKSRAQNLNLINSSINNDKVIDESIIIENKNQNSQATKNNNDNIVSNAESKSILLEHSESFININNNNGTGKNAFITDSEIIMDDSLRMTSKSVHDVNVNGFDSPHQNLGTRQGDRMTPGSIALQRYYSDTNVYTPITRSGINNDNNNNNYFINVFESFRA